jgi:hypothetical protein
VFLRYGGTDIVLFVAIGVGPDIDAREKLKTV